MTTDPQLLKKLSAIAEALNRLAPPPPEPPSFKAASAFVWHADTGLFQSIKEVNCVPLDLLCGIDFISNQLLLNTKRFASGLPANNALLWGARGMGKSSLVKAVHAAIIGTTSKKTARNGHRPKTVPLKLIEIHRDDINSLPSCLAHLRNAPERFIVFCDDLSFDNDDTSYKSLKAVLEGGLEGRPANVIFYATSNRRHLMPREMMENESSTAIRPNETLEEKISLSDRFGLWLGFHNASQGDYLDMVRAYAKHYSLEIADDALTRKALEWAMTRGARSGRVAWQFTQDLAGSLGQKLSRP